MPLKALHPLLEDGCIEDEEPTPEKKVAFIGISNWALGELLSMFCVIVTISLKFYIICHCIGQFFIAFATQVAILEDDFTEVNCCEAQRCGEKAFTRYCIPNFIVMIKVKPF